MGNSVFSAVVFRKAAILTREARKTIYWCSRCRKPLYSIVHAHIQGFVTKGTGVAAKVQKTTGSVVSVERIHRKIKGYKQDIDITQDIKVPS